MNNYEHVMDEVVPQGVLLVSEKLWLSVPSLVFPGEDWPEGGSSQVDPGGGLPDWQQHGEPGHVCVLERAFRCVNV